MSAQVAVQLWLQQWQTSRRPAELERATQWESLTGKQWR
jgi:hypothetical protein